ncbi:MAG: PQQ-binding-like beta-propeller repeat protein [Planctomycetes bacterium]|nr:PQQ-binding-like beta-propeller repeat protein [Planctomycetota bacterium]
MKFRLAFLILLSVVATIRAEDVTQFRGPGGLGISKETGLPTKWTADDGIRWKATLPGKGLSNPVIAGGRVYVTATAAYQQKREVVLCFDVKTGKKLWERQVWATGHTQAHPKTNMAAPTPMTDGERVYALFATGDLVAYDKDGDLAWYRSLVGDYPTVGNNVGMAASPALHGDTILICLENAGESFAVGIDKNTGLNRWRIERPRGINWVSPVVLPNGPHADVLFQGPTGIDAHDVVTGKKKWSAPGIRHGAYATLTVGDGVVYAPSSKFTALRPGKDAEAQIVWQSPKLSAGYCSPIAHGGLLYVVAGGGVVHCADAKTGDTLWTLRLTAGGSYAASPLLADGKLYVVNEAGVTSVVKVSRKDGELLAANPIGDTILASPVASDGAIFLRSDGALYCIGAKK